MRAVRWVRAVDLWLSREPEERPRMATVRTPVVVFTNHVLRSVATALALEPLDQRDLVNSEASGESMPIFAHADRQGVFKPVIFGMMG